MLQTRIVPWTHYEEFETVYHWLFADRKTQLDTIQLGIDRVRKTNTHISITNQLNAPYRFKHGFIEVKFLPLLK